MARFKKVPPGLGYLEQKSKIVRWEVIAGPEVSFIQSYDVIFDEYDYKIRQLPY